MEENCLTCEHGKPMVGVIYCDVDKRVNTSPIEPCENYKVKLIKSE